MTVRLASVDDARELSALHCASFPGGWSEADFRTWLARPEGFACVVIRERDAVAFGLALAAGDDAELLTIATARSQRRTGLATEIFRALDQEAGTRGLTRWV